METINLNKFEAFNFDFSVVQRLAQHRDNLTYKDENKYEIFVTSDTKFSIDVTEKDFTPFQEIMDKMTSGEMLPALDYKKIYVYEHQLYSFEGYGAFPVSIQFPELNHNSNSDDLINVELNSDYVKLNIKDMKGFLDFFGVRLTLTKNHIY